MKLEPSFVRKIVFRLIGITWVTAATTSSLFSQEIEREVIASIGITNASFPGLEISFTVGEPNILFKAGGAVDLSEGFQQGKSSLVGVFTQFDNQMNWRVFPNPTTGSFFFEGQLKKPKFPQIELYNSSGQKCLESMLEMRGQSFSMSISLVGYASGQYFLKVINGGKEVGEITILKH